MATNLPINETETDKGEALKANVDPTKQTSIINLFGTIDIDPDYDYKEQRRHIDLE